MGNQRPLTADQIDLDKYPTYGIEEMIRRIVREEIAAHGERQKDNKEKRYYGATINREL